MADDQPDIVEHMIENQLVPQIIAAEIGVDVATVYTGDTNMGDEWITIRCIVCDRSAQAPRASIPAHLVHLIQDDGVAVAVCPRCIR